MRTVHNVDKVVELSLENKSYINVLIVCMVSSNKGLAMRAADALEKIFQKKPDLLKDKVEKLIETLSSNSQKEVRWHIAQILPKLTMNDTQLKQATEVWVDDFYNSKSSIVRTFSLQAMHDVSKNKPLLKSQYNDMLTHALSKGSSAMKARAKLLINN